MEALKRKFGGFYFKTHGNHFQGRGLPDIMGCVRGRLLGIEVKLPGKEHELTPIQKATLKKINRAGGLGVMVSSVEQAEEAVNEYIKEKS